jgi:hypothetical protein
LKVLSGLVKRREGRIRRNKIKGKVGELGLGLGLPVYYSPLTGTVKIFGYTFELVIMYLGGSDSQFCKSGDDITNIGKPREAPSHRRK